jgi:hypothetical protein
VQGDVLTTSAIFGISLELSRERIRQLVQKRLLFYKNRKWKGQFRVDVTAIARDLLALSDVDNDKDNATVA